MPLTFQTQQQKPKRPGLWVVPVVLLVACVLIISVGARSGGGGVFGAARAGVQGISNSLAAATSAISSPFDALAQKFSSSEDDSEVDLSEENAQLRALVAELEEYRQEAQRLNALLGFSDAYALETVAATVKSTTTGWDRTAIINVGTADGVAAGMGVISSCGLYGQVETVTEHTATVRLVSDASSSVAAMVQSTRATGILSGSYEGVLTLEYISIDESIGEGDFIVTSGQGGTYPAGVLIGIVSSVEVDSSKLYYNATVVPVYSFELCADVLVLTGNESEVATILNESLLSEITTALGTTTEVIVEEAADEEDASDEADEESASE